MNPIDKAKAIIEKLDKEMKNKGMMARMDIYKNGNATLWIHEDSGDLKVLADNSWCNMATIDAWAEAQANAYRALFNLWPFSEQ